MATDNIADDRKSFVVKGGRLMGKAAKLERIRSRVNFIDDKWKAPGVAQMHRIVAVLGIYMAEVNGGSASAEDIQEALEDLETLGKVVREEFCLRPLVDENCWEVTAMRPTNDDLREEG